jgi:uncharacterized membrane protein YkoI
MRKIMTASITALSLAGCAALIVATASGATAATGEEIDTPISGAALASASSSALAHLGAGTVTATEVGDEESYYEVEVTLDNGEEVDVQLNREFTVVSAGTESGGEANGE